MSYEVYNAVESVPIDDFLVELTYLYPDTPSGYLQFCVRRAIDRLCRVGNVLRRNVSITVQSCVENYKLFSPHCEDFVAIRNIRSMCGSCCGSITRFVKAPCYLPCGTASWFEFPDTIFFRPAQDGAEFDVELIVAPDKDACEIDRYLFDYCYDIIMNGAKSMLLSADSKLRTDRLKSQEYRIDRSKAQEYKVYFENGIRAAAVERMMNGQRGTSMRTISRRGCHYALPRY